MCYRNWLIHWANALHDYKSTHNPPWKIFHKPSTQGVLISSGLAYLTLANIVCLLSVLDKTKMIHRLGVNFKCCILKCQSIWNSHFTYCGRLEVNFPQGEWILTGAPQCINSTAFYILQNSIILNCRLKIIYMLNLYQCQFHWPNTTTNNDYY